MFRFLKDVVASAREGIDEAKLEAGQQAAATAEAGQLRAAELTARVACAPPQERFVATLSAVYRAVFFDELENAALEQRPPAFLMLMAVPSSQVDRTRRLLDRDFDVDDAAALRAATGALGHELRETLEPEIGALLTTRLCWVATAAAGVGLVSADDALGLTHAAAERARISYPSWSAYGHAFLAGERSAPGSNVLGRRALAAAVDALLRTPGSPWGEPWPASPTVVEG